MPTRATEPIIELALTVEDGQLSASPLPENMNWLEPFVAEFLADLSEIFYQEPPSEIRLAVSNAIKRWQTTDSVEADSMIEEPAE